MFLRLLEWLPHLLHPCYNWWIMLQEPQICNVYVHSAHIHEFNHEEKINVKTCCKLDFSEGVAIFIKSMSNNLKYVVAVSWSGYDKELTVVKLNRGLFVVKNHINANFLTFVGLHAHFGSHVAVVIIPRHLWCGPKDLCLKAGTSPYLYASNKNKSRHPIPSLECEERWGRGKWKG